MKIGADRKKIYMLGGLLLLLAFLLYSNFSSSSDVPPEARRASKRATLQRPDPTDAVFAPASETRPRPPLVRPGGPDRLKLTLKDKKADPTAVDPTLRLDLLARLQAVNMEGGDRNLFQFGAAPMPKTPEKKIIPQPAPHDSQPNLAGNGPTVEVKQPPPPIPLKFYGYSNSMRTAGEKRAFFLDGDDIVVATEGQLIKQRYKVIRIGVNSVVVEDMQFQNQQTLPLEEPSQMG